MPPFALAETALRCYDILPESFRTITIDTRMTIRSAINAMNMNGQFRVCRHIH